MPSILQTLALALALTASQGVLAQAQPARPAAPAGGNIEFRTLAEMEVEVKGADGKVEKKRVPVEKATPGMQVIYTSSFKNTGSRPAGNIVVNNPIPANTTLVPASAYGDQTDIAFSADGGKTYATADKVTVKGADGKVRPAGISEFTHIRWTYRGELPPAQQGVIGFRVVVN